ncbi:MAG: DNA-deoxyinosine glycosylase [Brotaphodocola sp.]
MVETVFHEFPPLYDKQSSVLILGTIPSPKSREQGFYYGHPRNRFWKMLACVFEETEPKTIEEKKQLVLRHHVALWDVLASCSIEGASDSSIRNVVPNDMNVIFSQAAIKAVFTTGTKATVLYRKYCEPMCHIPCIGLPSTSPANCRMTDENLLKEYLVIKQYL